MLDKTTFQTNHISDYPIIFYFEKYDIIFYFEKYDKRISKLIAVTLMFIIHTFSFKTCNKCSFSKFMFTVIVSNTKVLNSLLNIF